jgi:polysaccharide export outer membrane protein
MKLKTGLWTGLWTGGLLLLSLALAALPAARPALAQGEYAVRPGDILRIEVIEDPSLNRSVLVPPDGRINLPLAGTVQAGGRGVTQIQTDLASLLAPNFAAPPSVFVSIEQLYQPPPPVPPVPPATVPIYVLGEVASPGLVAITEGTTVLQLFAQIGGFSPFAATKRIQLRRTDANGVEQVYLINYDAIEQGGSKSGATTLREDDVIIVPQRRLFE